MRFNGDEASTARLMGYIDKLRDPAAGDEVRCLACGSIYSKPVSGESPSPNCPRCGYVGWLAISIPLDSRPLRQQAKRPPLH